MNQNFAIEGFNFRPLHLETLSLSSAPSVTRLGDFWKFFAANFVVKVTQVFGSNLGYFAVCHFSRNGNSGFFLVNCCKIWVTFNSNMTKQIPTSGNAVCALQQQYFQLFSSSLYFLVHILSGSLSAPLSDVCLREQFGSCIRDDLDSFN